MSSERDVRKLCAKVLEAKEADSFQASISELRIALRDHVVEAENKGIHLILKMSKVKDTLRDGTAD